MRAPSFPELLIRLRESEDWSQEIMGEMLTAAGYPMSRQAVSHLETGRNVCNGRVSVAYRAVFGLDGKDLASFNAAFDGQWPPEKVAAA